MLVPLVVLLPFVAWNAEQGWPALMRDRLFRIFGWSLAVGLMVVEPGLGLLAAVALWKWRDHRSLRPVLLVLAGGGIYLVAQQVPPELRPIILYGFVIGIVFQVGFALFQQVWYVSHSIWPWPVMEYNPHHANELRRGTTGNRVVLGVLCAMALPLSTAVGVSWLWAPCLLGVLFSRSYTALGSAVAALCILQPTLSPLIAASALLGYFAIQHIRPNPAEGFVERLKLWMLLVLRWWRGGWAGRLVGYGPDSTQKAADWWLSKRILVQRYRHAHSDPVQVLYEWGALGVLAVLLWLGHLWPGLALGDPLTAALAAVLVNAFVQFPLHLAHVLGPTLIIAGFIAK